GSGNGGLNGVRFLSGKDLNLENDVIFGFTQNCVDVELAANATFHIIDSVTKNCGNDGIFATTSAGLVKGAITGTSVMVSTTNGVEAGNNSRVTFDRGLVSASGASGVLSTGANSLASVDNSSVNNNTNGVTASAGGTISISHTTMTGNTTNGY